MLLTADGPAKLKTLTADTCAIAAGGDGVEPL
jgi:hypothetical protein